MAEHYYTKQPTTESQVREISYEAGGETYSFLTDHSVFSIERVDYGTDLLIRTALKNEAALENADQTLRLLDLGCGYGPIGIVVGQQLKAEQMDLLDVNERAMELARKNALKNGIMSGLRTLTEDELQAEDQYEIALTNPPIRAGKKTVFHLFDLAHEHLAPGGRLYVVIQKKQGADSAVKHLKETFGECETMGRGAGYHILLAVK